MCSTRCSGSSYQVHQTRCTGVSPQRLPTVARRCSLYARLAQPACSHLQRPRLGRSTFQCSWWSLAGMLEAWHMAAVRPSPPNRPELHGPLADGRAPSAWLADISRAKTVARRVLTAPPCRCVRLTASRPRRSSSCPSICRLALVRRLRREGLCDDPEAAIHPVEHGGPWHGLGPPNISLGGLVGSIMGPNGPFGHHGPLEVTVGHGPVPGMMAPFPMQVTKCSIRLSCVRISRRCPLGCCSS